MKNYDHINKENLTWFIELHSGMTIDAFFREKDQDFKEIFIKAAFETFTDHQMPDKKGELVKSTLYVEHHAVNIMCDPPDYSSIKNLDGLVTTMKDFCKNRDTVFEKVRGEIESEVKNRMEQLERSRGKKKTRYQNKELGIEGEMEL